MSNNVQLYKEFYSPLFPEGTKLVKVIDDGTDFCGYAPSDIGRLFSDQEECISEIGRHSWEYLKDADLIGC